MSRNHSKHVRAKWSEMTETERDLASLGGLRMGFASRAQAKDAGVAEGARRTLAALDRALERLVTAPRRPFDVRGADRLADEVAVLVLRKIIDSRSPAGDALLDYRNPPSTPRADRLAELERAGEALATWVEQEIAAEGEDSHGYPPTKPGREALEAWRALAPRAAASEEKESGPCPECGGEERDHRGLLRCECPVNGGRPIGTPPLAAPEAPIPLVLGTCLAHGSPPHTRAPSCVAWRPAAEASAAPITPTTGGTPT